MERPRKKSKWMIFNPLLESHPLSFLNVGINVGVISP
jgi:hypothetical protein